MLYISCDYYYTYPQNIQKSWGECPSAHVTVISLGVRRWYGGLSGLGRKQGQTALFVRVRIRIDLVLYSTSRNTEGELDYCFLYSYFLLLSLSVRVLPFSSPPGVSH